MNLFVLIISIIVLIFIFLVIYSRRIKNWGPTAIEQQTEMSGDKLLDNNSAMKVRFTRALNISRSPSEVWPWISQLGRGAGFYSHDWLDNGWKRSAHHQVSWIPEPQLGDASALGYIYGFIPHKEIIWWMPGIKFLGCRTRMVINFFMTGIGENTRLVIRISGDAEGKSSLLAMTIFTFIDSIMAKKQLLGIKLRSENRGNEIQKDKKKETGERDQYQYYEVIYSSGLSAGVKGKEQAAIWRQKALESGMIRSIEK